MTSAPALVLLPGLDGTGDLFAPFIAVAARRFEVQVLRYDQQRDQSYAGLASALLPMLPREGRFVLVAESFGSPLALRLAAAEPTGLAAVVLVNGFARAPSLLGRAVLSLPILRGLSRGLSRTPSWALRRYLIGDDAPAALVSLLQQTLRKVPASTLSARLLSLAVCDETESYLRCTAPMFYLKSSEDRLLGAAALATLEYLRPGLCVESIAAPHLLLQRAPDAAFAALVRLLLEDRQLA
jgi:pimeloyl-ACP methyl ester carboxylesterase